MVRDELGGNEHGLPKGVKPTALTAFALPGDAAGLVATYTGFAKWVYRSDETVDDSYLCYLAMTGLRQICYTFPRAVAIIQHFHGQRLLDKYQGNKAAVRNALALTWHDAEQYLEKKGQLKPVGYTPKVQPRQAKRDVIYSRRGRGSDHAALVDKVYSLLQEHRVGTQYDVNISKLAAEMGIHRRTVITVLDELQAAGRIGARKRQAGDRGLLIDLEPKRDVINEAVAAPVLTIAKPNTKRDELLLEDYSNNHTVYLLEQSFDHISQQPAELETLDTLTDLVEQGLDLARATSVATRKMYGFVLDFVLTYGTRPYKPASVAAEYEEVLTLQQYQRRAERIAEKPTGTLRGLADAMSTASAKYQQRGEYKRAYAYRCIAETCLTELERRENIPPDEQGMPLQPAAGMPMPGKEQLAWADKPMLVDTAEWQQWGKEQMPRPAPGVYTMAVHSALWDTWGVGADLSHLAAPQAVQRVALNVHAKLLRYGFQFSPMFDTTPTPQAQTCPQTALRAILRHDRSATLSGIQPAMTSAQNGTPQAASTITRADVSTSNAPDVVYRAIPHRRNANDVLRSQPQLSASDLAHQNATELTGKAATVQHAQNYSDYSGSGEATPAIAPPPAKPADGWIVRKFGPSWYAWHESTNKYIYTATKAEAIAATHKPLPRPAMAAAWHSSSSGIQAAAAMHTTLAECHTYSPDSGKQKGSGMQVRSSSYKPA